MAGDQRSERQLMRQRGAGLRDVNNVDFGLKFGAQDSRQDRQLMRQRGAGNRKIDNIDFGFSFPTPNQSRRSSRTPQILRRSSERSSNTPSAGTSRHPSLSKSVRKNTTELLPLDRGSATPQPMVRGEQPNSSKRRRLNKDNELSATANIVVKIPPKRPSFGNPEFSIAEEGEVEAVDLFRRGIRISSPRILNLLPQSESPLFFPQDDDDDKENDRASTKLEDSVTERKQNTSAHRRSNLYVSPPLDDVLDNSIVDSIEGIEDEEDGAVRNDTGHEFIVTAPIVDVTSTFAMKKGPNTNTSSGVKTNGINGTAPGTNPTKRRKKRKSVILGPKKRRSLESRATRVSQLEESDISSETPNREGSDERLEEQQQGEMDFNATAEKTVKRRTPLWKQIAVKHAQKRRTRLSVSASPVGRKDIDEEDDETYVEEDESPEPVTPAPRKRKTIGRNVRGRADTEQHSKQSSNVSRRSFPITIHRITNASALPTIAEDDETSGEAGTDMSQPPQTFSNRVQPNAVDVLAQICRETIQTAIESLSTSLPTNNSRAEMKHKRTVLEAFGENLDQRLFEMSEAVEHRTTLEARLRKSKREKAELQARWAEIRRQRDDLALKADAIRRQNWENEEEGRRQWEISELAHQTELVLDSTGTAHEDLEFMLKEVADQVSSAGSQGGTLGRIRSFNKRLERIAVTLEAKQA